MAPSSPIDRLVVVTGASTGIGRGTAECLARLGYRVFAGVRRAEDAAALEAASPRITPLRLDVTDEASLRAAASQLGAAAADPGVFALVNNAGIAVAGPAEVVPLAEWRRQLDVNVLGAVAVCQALLPLMSRGSRIVMVGSVSGRVAYPLLGPYSASKHALVAVAEAMRLELAPAGIAVTLVEPGNVRTPIWSKSIAQARQVIAGFRAAQRERYGSVAAGVLRTLDGAGSRGLDVDVAAAAVARIVGARRPPPRVLLGRDAWLGACLALLPARWRLHLIARATGGGG